MGMARSGAGKWFIIGAMAFGLVSLLSARSALAQRHEHEDYDKTISVEELPREARHTAEAEAHGHPILAVQHVRHGDHEFFRVTIDGHYDVDKIVRIGMDGRVLSVDDAVDAAYVLPHRYVREEEITWGPDHPERVGWERMPAVVRAILMREAEGGKIEEVVAFRDHNHVIFQSTVADPDDSHKHLVLQVGYDGALYGDLAVGHGRIERSEVHFRDLPDNVRETIARESDGHKFETITVESHHGRTFYVFDFPYHHGQRWLMIDKRGHVISDTFEHD